jgi:hypothetical protein
MDDPNQAMSFRDKLLYDIAHRRKYAPEFNWTGPDREEAKHQKETLVVQYFLKARYRGKGPYVRVDSCEPPKPDCELTDKEGRKTGVEITELVDREMVERNVTKLSHGRVYTSDQVLEAVAERLEKKERGLERRADFIRSQQYKKMILVIHTGEPELTPDFCRASLENQTFPNLQFIDETFLLFRRPRAKHPDDYEADFHQLVAIPLGRSSQQK